MDEQRIRKEVRAAISELLQTAGTKAGDIVVVGCSTSEVQGDRIGKHPGPALGEAIFEELRTAVEAKGAFLACQCCEHLNRALVIEREAANRADIVNAVPQPKAGGSFATAAYKGFKDPVVVERIAGDCALDIGQTLIGMHLRPVAVPVRLATKKIGEAVLTAARVRPKYIGGPRAIYDENLM